MSHDPQTPIADQPGGLWVQRVIGALALLLGFTLAVFFAFCLFKLVAEGGAAQLPVLIFSAVIAVLAAFFLSAGARMTFNRPNRHGSLLTPGLWFAIAALFFAGAVLIAYLLVASRQFARLDAVGSALVLGMFCVMAGRRARKKRSGVA